MAVSRQREYLADATAAEYTRNPRGLARALEKFATRRCLSQSDARHAHLFLINPLRRRIDERDGKIADWLASHPPIERRILLLYRMAGHASAIGSRFKSSSGSIEQNLPMLRCPQCDCEMAEVMARANPGTLIQLDQCGKCGGVWCDKWELFPVDPDEADRLDPLNENLLREALPLPQRHSTARAAPTRCRYLPIRFYRKKFNYSAAVTATAYGSIAASSTANKDYQRGTRAVKMSEEKVVAKLPEVYANPKSWVVTGTEGNLCLSARRRR